MRGVTELNNYICSKCGCDLMTVVAENIYECTSCGSRQLISGGNTDESIMCSQADEYRRRLDFHRAIRIYERVLAKNPYSAEASWGMVLSIYGITYAKDTASGRMVPTCNRIQTKSILENEHYLNAVRWADPEMKPVYQADADYIDRVVKEALRYASSEKAGYDIFISFKSEQGNVSTEESYIAHDLYNALTDKGYRVFFSKVTLALEHGGEKYEPVIYNALSTSRIMFLFASSRENIEAPWVKNEWTRYLDITKNHPERNLFICYNNDFEYPDELKMIHKRSYTEDDFIRKTVYSASHILPVRRSAPGSTLSESLEHDFTKAVLALNDGKFKEAKEKLEEILDAAPKHSGCYWNMLLIENALRSERELLDQSFIERLYRHLNVALLGRECTFHGVITSFTEAMVTQLSQKLIEDEDALRSIVEDELGINYSNAVRFASTDEIAWYERTFERICSNILQFHDNKLRGYAQYHSDKQEYGQAMALYQLVNDRSLCEEEYQDCIKLAESQRVAAEEAENANNYRHACSLLEAPKYETPEKKCQRIRSAYLAFHTLGSYRDSAQKAEALGREYATLSQKLNKKEKRTDTAEKTVRIIGTVICIIYTILLAVFIIRAGIASDRTALGIQWKSFSDALSINIAIASAIYGVISPMTFRRMMLVPASVVAAAAVYMIINLHIGIAILCIILSVIAFFIAYGISISTVFRWMRDSQSAGK